MKWMGCNVFQCFYNGELGDLYDLYTINSEFLQNVTIYCVLATNMTVNETTNVIVNMNAQPIPFLKQNLG